MGTVIDMTNVAIVREVLEYGIVSSFLGFLLLAFFFFGILWFMKSIVCPRLRPTQYYRKVLMDLFVAGKIKKFAKDDDIILAEEEKDFHKWTRKQRLTDIDLDNAIEERMKEKISEEALEKLGKKEKESK